MSEEAAAQIAMHNHLGRDTYRRSMGHSSFARRGAKRGVKWRMTRFLCREDRRWTAHDYDTPLRRTAPRSIAVAPIGRWWPALRATPSRPPCRATPNPGRRAVRRRRAAAFHRRRCDCGGLSRMCRTPCVVDAQGCEVRRVSWMRRGARCGVSRAWAGRRGLLYGAGMVVTRGGADAEHVAGFQRVAA